MNIIEKAMDRPQIHNGVNVFVEDIVLKYRELDIESTDKDKEFMREKFFEAMCEAHKEVLSEDDFIAMHELFTHEKYSKIIEKIWSKELSYTIGVKTGQAASEIIQYMSITHAEEMKQKMAEFGGSFNARS